MTQPTLDSQTQSRIDNAQQVLAQGKPQEAAPLFAQIAQELEGGHPRRAANLHGQAAHAYADSNNEAAALTQARLALTEFIKLGINDRTPQFFSNIVRKLRNHSWAGSADALQQEFGAQARSLQALSAAQLAAVSHANQLLANGHPLRAAAQLAQVTQQVEANQPPRAPNLHAGAAHAYADGHDEANTLTQARAALTLFIKYEMTDRTPVFFTNITTKLRNKGQASAADLLQKEFGAQAGTAPSASATPAAPIAHGRLPSSCPTCGAPARSDEVEWVDNQSAVCNYCGGVLQAA